MKMGVKMSLWQILMIIIPIVSIWAYVLYFYLKIKKEERNNK